MKKFYPLFLLLLVSIGSFAQENLSPVLKKFFTVPDSSHIIDYRYKKVLSYKQNGDAFTYYLSDVRNHTTTIIPFTKKFPAPYGNAWITPSGVVFIGQSPDDDATWSLYEWKPGSLTTLATNMGNVNVAGDYVMWTIADTVTSGYDIMIRRNMATLEQIVVADTVLGQASMGPNGNIAYTDRQFVYFYRNNAWKVVATTDTIAFYPWLVPYLTTVRTDGEKITYEEWVQEQSQEYHLNVIENDTVKLLFVNVVDDFQRGGYQDLLTALMNNGYIAGQQLISGGWYHFRTNIYSRDPQGTIHNLQQTYTQQPPWGLASVRVLTSQGDIGGYTAGATSHSGGPGFWYYINHDGSKRRFLSTSGNGLYYEEQDSTWLLAEDPYLYLANVDTTYDHHIEPFTKQTYSRTRLTIRNSDFEDHYSGPKEGLGKIQRVEILTQRLKHGYWTADSSGLVYVPYTTPAIDTVRWRVFDGLEWTKDTTFYIVTLALPDTIKPFERSTLAGTPIRFWGSNFKQNFTGKLAGIRVNRLPAFGKLTIGGKQLFYERSRDVTLAELDSMYYTPNPNIIGTDTLQWMAFNGTDYTKNDTPAILRIYPILNTPPILRTLESGYSTSAGADTILIANYPAPRWHTDVLVLADNNRVLPIAPNNTFLIEPSTYSAGAHTLKVRFKHKLDSISIQRTFTITSPFAPMIMAAEKYETTQEEGPIHTWPNPFDQQFTLTGLSASGTYILTLVNQQGKTVLQQRVVNQNRVVLNLGTNAGTGVYLLKIVNADKKYDVKTLKLLHL